LLSWKRGKRRAKNFYTAWQWHSHSMDRVQKAVVISLIATSALAWIASIDQPDMMIAMTTYNPWAISLFAAS
jgi:hypothetical protein